MREPAFYGLAGLVLGGIETTMEEIVMLYAMLARGGELRPLRRTLEDPEKEGVRLFSREAAYLTLDILKDNPPPEQRGLSKWVKDPLAVAWKTGTSYAFRDAWSVAVFGRYVLAVWVGNFDGHGNPAFVGRRAAGPLLFEILDSIKSTHKNIDSFQAGETPDVIEVEVCALSGHFPGPHCPRTTRTLFIPGKSPITTCDIHRMVYIDPQTGMRVPWKDREGAKAMVYEFWPSDLLELFNRAGLPRRSPPPFDPRYSLEEVSYKGLPPEITSPVKKVVYNLRAGSLDKERIPLRAVTDGDVHELFWFINETFVGKSSGEKPLFWTPRVGKFIVRVVDDQGRSDAQDLIVSVVK
jgi:penicillin-binding protein 1C